MEYVCSSENGRITSSSDGKPQSSPTDSPASSLIDFGVGRKNKKNQKMGSFEDGDHRSGGVEYVSSSEIGRITSSSDGKPHSSLTDSPASSVIDFGVGRKTD